MGRPLYAAIEYEPSTGKWAAVHGHESVHEALRDAKRLLKARSSRTISTWSSGMDIIALAYADDGSWEVGRSSGWSKSADQAQQKALRKIAKRTNSPAEIVCWVQGGEDESW